MAAATEMPALSPAHQTSVSDSLRTTSAYFARLAARCWRTTRVRCRPATLRGRASCTAP